MSDIMSDEDVIQEEKEEIRKEDTMKILLATDCHLGYEQSTKRIQDNDSLITFEEILQHAHKEKVDFVLLGGDLFHDCKPSQPVLLKCVELLKKYTLGDREIKIEFLTNPEVIFKHCAKKLPNYEDPNMRIGLPVFSIHGNHDNPSFSATGTMDILGASGLVNYFGKWSDMQHIKITPMVIKKGRTYVSIYGLSYMNDQRLFRLIRDEKLTLLRPNTPEKPFNIMVLHQNRAKHTEKGYVDENRLPSMLDFVFWGHEHECRVVPEETLNLETSETYHICQPGSSVATSLCEGESRTKKIGVLHINRTKWKVTPIKLKTVRPFVFDCLSLRDMNIKQDLTRTRADIVFEAVDDYIENILLAKAKKKLTGHPDQPTVPLIRLKILYTEESEIFDMIKITRRYCDRVANPRDMVMFRKEKSGDEDGTKMSDIKVFDDDDFSEIFRSADDDTNWNKTVQGQIEKFFNREDRKDQLSVLSVAGLNQALKSFMETGDDDAFKDVVNHQLGKSREYLKKFEIDDEDEMIEQLKVYRAERKKTEEDGGEAREVQKFLDSATRKTLKPARKASTSRDAISLDSDDENLYNTNVSDEAKPARGGGRGSRGRARGARATTTSGRASSKRSTEKATKRPLDVNVFAFEPKANSSMLKPTPASSKLKVADEPLSQFRAKSTKPKSKQTIFKVSSGSDSD